MNRLFLKSLNLKARRILDFPLKKTNVHPKTQINVHWVFPTLASLETLFFFFLPSPAPAPLTSTTWPWTRWGRFSTCRTPPAGEFTACGPSASPKIRLATWKWWPAPASSASPSTRATAARAGRPRRLRSTTREVWKMSYYNSLCIVTAFRASQEKQVLQVRNNIDAGRGLISLKVTWIRQELSLRSFWPFELHFP